MVEKAILNPDYTVFCLFKHSKNLSGWMSGEGKYRKEKANEKGKESGKQLGVPFLALQIMGSCSIPVAVMPPQLGARASISGFSLLLLLCFFWTVQSSRLLSHVLFPLSVKSHCRGDSDQLLISVILKIVQWPWDNDMKDRNWNFLGTRVLYHFPHV